MTGLKTNERPGTRASLRHCRMSAYKARQVLDLVRGVEVERAREILLYCDRDAAIVIGKLLDSAVANAAHNDEIAPDELFVTACYADEGSTLKRWRPRARGRATRIRKRTCHITMIVARMPDEELRRRRARVASEAAERRARRVAGTRRARAATIGAPMPVDTSDDEELEEQTGLWEPSDDARDGGEEEEEDGGEEDLHGDEEEDGEDENQAVTDDGVTDTWAKAAGPPGADNAGIGSAKEDD